MVIFHSYVKLPEGNIQFHPTWQWKSPGSMIFHIVPWLPLPSKPPGAARGPECGHQRWRRGGFEEVDLEISMSIPIMYMSLVGGLEHDWIIFPEILGKIIPTDFHIFQRGRYTTNQVCIGISVSIGEQETQNGVHGLDGPLFCLLFGRCFSISNPAVHFLKCLQVPSQKRIE